MIGRKLPDCPICGCDELWYQRHVDRIQLKCYFCGWDSGFVTPLRDTSINESIAQLFRATKQRFRGNAELQKGEDGHGSTRA